MSKIIEQQLKHNDCGISAAKIIYNIHNIAVNRNFINENIFLNEQGSSIHDLKDFFDGQQFVTSFNLLDINSLKTTPEIIEDKLPCILPIKSKQGQHYVVIKSIYKKKFQIVDPAVGQIYNWSLSELMNMAYTATSNYDYVTNSQLFEQVIFQELGEYGIDAEEVEAKDKAEVMNKLTYFSYIKENFGFKDTEGEKAFLLDILLNQEVNTLPKQFRTIRLSNAKLKIKAPVVLTVKKGEEVKIPIATTDEVKPLNPYSRLVKEMKAYHKLWGIFIMAAVFAAFIGQLTIFSSQILIDNILPSYNLNLLILFAIGLGIFRIFVLILSMFKSFIAIHLANIFDNFFLSSFTEKLNTFSIRYIHSFSKGDLTERVKDSLKLKSFFISFFTSILIDGFIALYSLVILLIISWKITMIVVAILVIFIFWFKLVTPYIKENEKRRFLEKSNMFSTIFENIDGLQVIKSYSLEGTFMQRLAPKIKSILNIQKKMKYVSLINSGVIDFIITIASILIMVFLSQKSILEKTITMGQIITFIALSRQVFSSVSSILNENLDLQENSIILERYFDFGNDLHNKSTTGIHKKIKSFSLEKVEFRNVSFHYIPQRPVFTNLNFEIIKGEKIQLEGSNGAGKSTFCKVLSLLYAPDGGEILINNEKYGFYNNAMLRKSILLVSNEDLLFNDTLGFNISFDYNTNLSRILALAKEIGFYDFIAERPEGLDYIINEGGRNLSTGQRKKILMMRALLSDAEIIILDETLSGIDKASKEKIEEYINTQTERSFIIISHEPLNHLKFSKTLIMQNGIVEQLQHQGI